VTFSGNLLRLLPYFDRIKTVQAKSNYGSIKARLKSLEQFVATSFTVSVTTGNRPEMKIYKKLLADPGCLYAAVMRL
jgi:hypothetical protein